MISTLDRWRGVPVLSAGMPTQLEGAMHALMTVFYNYSGNDGDKHKLNKGELKQLLHSELNHFLTVKNHIAFNNCIYIVFLFVFFERKKIRNFSMYFFAISNNLNKMVSGHDGTFVQQT